MQGRGSISFDEERRKFRIYLSSQGVAEQMGFRKTLRFVYAHEFAHRFLFVPYGDGWVRALSQVAEGVQTGQRLSVVRKLSRIEENICNDVAGRVLVPEGHLQTMVTEFVGGGQRWRSVAYAFGGEGERSVSG